MKHAEKFPKEFDQTLEGFMPGLYKLPGVDFIGKLIDGEQNYNNVVN